MPLQLNPIEELCAIALAVESFLPIELKTSNRARRWVAPVLQQTIFNLLEHNMAFHLREGNDRYILHSCAASAAPLEHVPAFGRHVLAPPHYDGDKDNEKDACDNSDGSWIH
jgi:hypothetical protein